MAIARPAIKKEVEGQLTGAKTGLWANINRRKKLGISRPKSKSTISKEAYSNMKKGFPKKKSKGGLIKNDYEMKCVNDYTKNLL